MKPNILDLDPLFRDDVNSFLKQINGTAFKFIICQVKRTIEEQTALYAQGRKPIDEVNRLREIAKMAPISPNRNHIVTQTMKSRHLPNKDGFSEAFDIVAVDRATGNAIWSDNGKDMPYHIAYVLSLQFPRFEAGYSWKWQDLGHYQLRRT